MHNLEVPEPNLGLVEFFENKKRRKTRVFHRKRALHRKRIENFDFRFRLPPIIWVFSINMSSFRKFYHQVWRQKLPCIHAVLTYTIYNAVARFQDLLLRRQLRCRLAQGLRLCRRGATMSRYPL